MKLNILLLCNKPPIGNDANTIIDHIEAIENYSSHSIWAYSNLGDFSTKLDLNRFDVLIIHYSCNVLFDTYISKQAKDSIKAYKGLKVIFAQDEYRFINQLIDQLQYLEIDVFFTCFPNGEMVKVYQKSEIPNVSLYTNLTGYIPQRLLEFSNIPLVNNRLLHLGYRGRKVPFWLGELGYEKWSIVEKWNEFVHDATIKSDISFNEKDRIYGSKWIDFIKSCKATLGVESGASVMDFTGELEKSIDAHQLAFPSDDFYKVQALYLKDHEGKFSLNQISPRCFEAIALKTVLILYEGDYSGILIPNRHYIPLKKDFSNINEVLDKLLDDNYLQNMADVAYQEIAMNKEFSYEYFINRVDTIIADEFIKRKKEKTNKIYTQQEFANAIKYISIKKKIFKASLSYYYNLPPSTKLAIKVILRPKFAVKLAYMKCVHVLKKVSVT